MSVCVCVYTVYVCVFKGLCEYVCLCDHVSVCVCYPLTKNTFLLKIRFVVFMYEVKAKNCVSI